MRTTGAASLVVALLTAMFAAGPAAAQEPGPISMGEAMRMALELRPTMDAAQAGVDAAQSSLARARAAQLPTVEGYWDWRTRQSLARPVDVGGGTVQSSSGRSDSRDAGVSVNLTLYDSSTRISINQARASAEAAGHRLVDTRHELMLNVARLYLTALGQEQLAEVAATANAANIVDTAKSAGSFNTLLAAATAAGLADALATGDNLTVFAPTDEAFAKLPAGTVEDLLKPENKDKLVAILTYHVVGRTLTSDMLPGRTIHVKTLNSADMLAVTKSGGGVTVDKANVVSADIAADNGTIHVIDTVLLPE